MTTTTRLLRIEARRSVALWFVPGLAALVAWGTATTMRPDGAPALWARSSVQLGMMCIVAAFIMCGIGAWVAGRDRRRQTVDLLATMPCSYMQRELPVVAATAIWGIVGCLLAGACVVVIARRASAWGDPTPGPMVIGLLTVLAGTAIGYLVGTLLPNRFAAPLAATTFAAAVLLIGTRSTALAYLSPLAMDPRGSGPFDVFYRAPSLPVAQICLWLAGVTGCALVATLLWRHPTPVLVITFAGTLALAAGGARAAMESFVHPPWERTYSGQPLAAYEPACVDGVIPICVHPAYAGELATNAERIGRLVEPLVGIPGGPVQAEQRPSLTGLRPDGTLELMPGAFVVERAAYDLVHDPGTEINQAQYAIGLWLSGRAGEPIWKTAEFFKVGQPDEAVTTAVARFAALDPDTQRAWLSAHFQDLRAGRIGLDDLP